MQRLVIFRRLHHEKNSSEKGFSLVEMTMAFAIFLVAALAAYALYYMGTRSFKKAENVTDLQQNTRAGFDRMVRELRLAGFNHNADGTPSRPDEQIEGAWDTAVTIRGDFDAEDPTLSTTPETSLAGTFNIVTTGNDEIVTYALGKPTLPGSTAISFVADVVESTRDGDEETIGIPGPVLVQDDPPYTLYRISPRNVGGLTGFDGTFDSQPEFTYEPIAENIRSLTFRYFDFSGNVVNPNTPADPSDDIGGLDANRDTRTQISRVEIDLEGMTPDPDPEWTDPADTDASTQHHRKFGLTATVTPRNIGKKGIPDLDLQPPSTPTGLAACVGHCKGTLLTWNPNPPTEAVAEYRLAYGTTTGNLTSTRTTGNLWLHVDGLAETGTYYFAVAAIDAAGNSSAYSTEISATNVNDTQPGPVPGFSAAASTADPGIVVTWDRLADNDTSITGASSSGGCDIQKPDNRDLGGYALFRDVGSDPAVTLGGELVGPGSLNRNVQQYMDTGVVACRDYTYDIRALDRCGVAGDEQASTVTTQYTTNVLPRAPINVNAAESGIYKNLVVWDAVHQNVDGDPIAVSTYNVYRALGDSGNPPLMDDLYTLIGSSATTSFEDNYGGSNAPPVGYIFFYRVSALDDCPNESALSAPAGAECAFDGQVQITPADGTVIYGVRDIVVTADGSDTYVAGGVTVRDSYGNIVLGPVTSDTYPFTFSWDTRSLYPDTYIVTGAVVNDTGCKRAASVRVKTVTSPACCLSQTGQGLDSDNKADSNVVVRLLANLCENNLNATEMTVYYTLSDNLSTLDDIRWNGASVIGGNNHPSGSTFTIDVFIPSVFYGGGEQVVVFDFDRSLTPGDSVSFELTYDGVVVGQQTCTFYAVVNSSGVDDGGDVVRSLP
jgi:prepilin-type N-terminal cleavage/methylation domain-containing protein